MRAVLRRIGRSGAPLGALLLFFCLFPERSQAISETDLQLFPIDSAPAGSTVFPTGDMVWLDLGVEYGYSVVRTATSNPSNNNPDPANPATWTVLSYEATLTYLGGYVGEVQPELLVLTYTSLRQGTAGAGGLPPRIDAGYVLPSVFDAAGNLLDPVYVSDPAGGAITDDEGDLFLAYVFPTLEGVPQTFRFDIAIREPLTGPLQHFNRGFLVPEPASVTLLACALAGLLLAARFRRLAPVRSRTRR